MTQLLRRFIADTQGQDLIEYTVLLAFVVLGTAALYLGAGGGVSGAWSSSDSQLVATVSTGY
jgi:Flp pilus assembly pilin Flp